MRAGVRSSTGEETGNVRAGFADQLFEVEASFGAQDIVQATQRETVREKREGALLLQRWT